MYMTDTNSLLDKIQILDRKFIGDTRGWFFKIITGEEDFIQSHVGEVYLVSAVSGESRGGHYHEVALEWFTLIEGKADLVLEDIRTNEKLTLSLDKDNPITIMVPQFVAHRFDNNSDKSFIVVAYTNVQFNKEDTIQFTIK